jgi:ribosomal protein S18 acetylase RimI-like enzyme
VVDVEGKIAAMAAYPDDLMVCGALAGDQLVGLLVGKVVKDRLVIYDLFVAIALRRRGIGRQLVQLAIRESQVNAVAAEVNRENVASQALFEALDFQRTLSSDWFVLRLPRADQRGSP